MVVVIEGGGGVNQTIKQSTNQSTNHPVLSSITNQTNPRPQTPHTTTIDPATTTQIKLHAPPSGPSPPPPASSWPRPPPPPPSSSQRRPPESIDQWGSESVNQPPNQCGVSQSHTPTPHPHTSPPPHPSINPQSPTSSAFFFSAAAACVCTGASIDSIDRVGVSQSVSQSVSLSMRRHPITHPTTPPTPPHPTNPKSPTSSAFFFSSSVGAAGGAAGASAGFAASAAGAGAAATSSARAVWGRRQRARARPSSTSRRQGRRRGRCGRMAGRRARGVVMVRAVGRLIDRVESRRRGSGCGGVCAVQDGRAPRSLLLLPLAWVLVPVWPRRACGSNVSGEFNWIETWQQPGSRVQRPDWRRRGRKATAAAKRACHAPPPSLPPHA